jgi:hypothetical protein
MLDKASLRYEADIKRKQKQWLKNKHTRHVNP